MKRPSLQSILQVDNSYHSKFQYIRMLYDSNYSNTTICKNRITGEIIVLKENMNQKYFYQCQYFQLQNSSNLRVASSFISSPNL